MCGYGRCFTLKGLMDTNYFTINYELIRCAIRDAVYLSRFQYKYYNKVDHQSQELFFNWSVILLPQLLLES